MFCVLVAFVPYQISEYFIKQINNIFSEKSITKISFVKF